MVARRLTRPALWSGALGVALAVATFEGGYYLADALLLTGLVLAWHQGWRPRWRFRSTWIVAADDWRPRWWLLLALPMLAGLFWAPVPWITASYALRLGLLLALVPWVRAHRWDHQTFVWGLTAGLAVQTLLLLRLIAEFRPAGLALNASQVGQTGLALWLVAGPWQVDRWTYISAGVQLATSGARASVGAMWLAVLLAPRRHRLVAAVVVSLAAVGIAALHPASWRHFVSPATAVVRVENIDGPTPTDGPIPESRRAVLDFYGANAPPWRDPRLSWHGYGWGQYVQATGLVRPHNIPVLAAYELGVFALPFAGVIGWAVWTRRVPWQLALTLAALWQFVEEPLGRPEGLYLTAGMVAVWWRR